MKPLSDQNSIADQIKKILRDLGPCEIEKLSSACSHFSVGQIFKEIGRMRRTGEVILRWRGPATCVVSLPIHTVGNNPNAPSS